MNTTMSRFKDRICVVTGGANGIGEATARRMAAEGGAVMVLDLKESGAQAVADQIAAEGGFAEGYACDISDEAAVQGVFAQIEQRHGRVDVLVNNAGIIGPQGLLETLSLKDWESLMAVNVTGVFLCTREALRLMKKTGAGSIVNVSSIAGLVGSPGISPYTASKGAIRLLTKAVALEAATDGIRVNSVHPGAILTPMVQSFAEGSGQAEAVLEGLAQQHPLGRAGRPEEVAAAITFLASDEASFMTGSEVVVDGGFTAK